MIPIQEMANATVYATEFRRMANADVAVSALTLERDDHVLAAHLLYVPPLEMPLLADQCERRIRAHMEAGINVLTQNYMATTRGLPPCSTAQRGSDFTVDHGRWKGIKTLI